MIENLFTELRYKTQDAAAFLVPLLTFIQLVIIGTLLVYIHGFEPDASTAYFAFDLLEYCLIGYAFIYFLKYFYELSNIDSIKLTTIETLLTLIITARFFGNSAFGNKFISHFIEFLGWSDWLTAYEIGISLLSMAVFLTQMNATIDFSVGKVQVKPALTFVFSFIALILIGTGLLMLPAMTRNGIAFTDALFMATSAACVTGLSVIDVANELTIKGQLILLILIQLGGVGIVTFAIFFTSFSKDGIGLKNQTLIQDFLAGQDLAEGLRLLKSVFFTTVLIEVLGAIFIFGTWGDEVQFKGIGQKIYFSVFHSISAFCNAGFSLFSNGLYENPVRNSYFLHLVIAAIIITGGIGFNTLYDLFSPTQLRERLRKPWKDWMLGTKLALFVSVFLIMAGMLLFFLLEKDNVLAGHSASQKMILSFFQSITTRTAGFNTVDISALSTPTLFMMMGLMFIGASPCSTGGGIKTTTFFLIVASTIATIRHRKTVDISGREIPTELITKALSVFGFAVAYNFTAVFLLTVTEQESGFNFINILFEQVSAFGTAGLSTGITASISTLGKLILVMSMFAGRVGILTLVLAFSTSATPTTYRHPKGYVMVG
jgi:potassium uptake TrkH family protein